MRPLHYGRGDKEEESRGDKEEESRGDKKRKVEMIKKGKNIVLMQASDAEYIHRQIYDALGLSCSPIKNVITKF